MKKYNNTNLGNGQTTTNEDDAKRALLSRDYPEIANYETIQQNEFRHGSMGAIFIPPVFITKIPNVAEPQDYVSKYANKASSISRKEHDKNMQTITEQSAEKAVYDGIHSYFKNSNEDVLVTFNQDISDKSKTNPTWHERDALVINCSRGYILVMEAKGYLTSRSISKAKSSSLTTALNQLSETTAIFNQNHSGNLKKQWEIISTIFASKIDPSLNFCVNCQKYILSPSSRNFVSQLDKILNQIFLKDVTYANDFHYLAKEIIPLRVRISKHLSNTFFMNSTILSKVQENMEEAGSAEMVAFWSKSQFNLAIDWKANTRVLFDSAFSTGKTISMLHCIIQLLKQNQKVIFVIHEDWLKKLYAKDCPSMLKMKIQNHFDQLYQNGQFQNSRQNFKVVEVDLSNKKAFDDLLQNHPDHHFFVDEIKFRFKGMLSDIRNKTGIDCGVTPDLLRHWSSSIPSHLHLWVAVCYNKNGFDTSLLGSRYSTKPQMIHALRNVAETVDHVKSKKNLKIGSKMNEIFYILAGTAFGGASFGSIFGPLGAMLGSAGGLAFGAALSVTPTANNKSNTSLNDTSKLDEVATLQIPNNLTRSFDPKTINAKNYKDGLQQVFTELDSSNLSSESALIVIPWHYFKRDMCGCYKKKTMAEFIAHIDLVYQQFPHRQKPNVYMDQTQVQETKNWVTGPKTNDMITDFNLVNGCEHPIVVVFNRNGFFEHNMSMRSTGLLITVDVPYVSWISNCFCDNPGWTHYPVQSKLEEKMSN